MKHKPSTNGVSDMAAQLFAELFYRQVMAEREAKLKEKKSRSKKIDDKPKKGL